MEFFELTLALLLLAVFLTGISRRLQVPYPALLALAGAGLGFLPGSPTIEIDPDLALVLFVAPVLLDAAFDTSLRDLKRNWIPLVSLALGAVVFTTVTVALVGWQIAGLPLAAAIALGAIVAPPDAVAASVVLGQFKVPQRITAILQGESLLNDATALLVFRLAVAAAAGPVLLTSALPIVALSTIGSLVAGYVFGQLSFKLIGRIDDAASGTVVQFASTFAVWIVAEKLGLSAIITIVVYAMTIARAAPRRMSPRNRVSSYSVWETVVFVLNVLAFVLMGLQARVIVERLAKEGLVDAFAFAFGILGVVIVTRLVWVLGVGAILRSIRFRHAKDKAVAPTFRGGVLIGWCGMRGLVTLAAAFALPQDFPHRDPIVLAAFCVVLGTLVLQGMTLKPLLRILDFKPDESVEKEAALARVAIMDAALKALDGETSVAAETVREQYSAQRTIAEGERRSEGATEHDRLRLRAIEMQRDALERLRSDGTIGDEAYHHVEEEIDWEELAASPRGRFQPLNS